ncbi:hypothetical protein GMB86_11890 [Terrilactibacillus sp. BCM23-1]|uniref:Uncharacterized protein n=2 Tax=Terrilactibacillus tamarindi TaxID=2599694 RepID=A0A6N8CSR9_9BACI|nr:hypothetical protein [Terrilactibacillus tamarindi]
MKKEINIYEALKNIPQKHQIWFKYLFPDLTFNGGQFDFEKVKNQTGIKTEFPIRRWQSSDEYKNLVALYLSSKSANDLIKVYKIVQEKAITGDDKAVKLFLSVSKEIDLHKKVALKAFTNLDQEQSDEGEDGLEL